jgi:copper(I)-binding protein
MVIDTPQALNPGDLLSVTLLFENAGAREVSFTVKDAR